MGPQLLIALLLVLVAPSAHAELDPGWYATGCKQGHAYKTEAAAKKHCRRKGPVVKVGAPAFWASDYGQFSGPTKDAVLAKCEQWVKQTRASRATDSDYSCATHAGVDAVYGPFMRKGQETYVYLNADHDWVDDHGATPCFPAGTMVATPAGPKPIESVAVGDAVISWDPNDSKMVVARVARVKTRTADALLELHAGTHTLKATANHPIWSPSRDAWIEAGGLRAGDTVSVRDGDTVQVVVLSGIATTPMAGAVEVYDLSIDPTHSFFAEGVWVHNY